MLDGLGVGHVLEARCRHVLERGEHGVVDALVEELEIGAAVLEHVLDDVLQKVFGERHVAGEIAEGHLRLDHPELGQVARRVGVLGAERGAEGVDVAEREGEDLAFELPADGEVGGLAEEVAREVDARRLACAAGSPDRAW